MMGGTLHLASTPGQGSLFALEVPLPVLAAQEPDHQAEVPSHIVGVVGRPKVLVVDDKPVNRSVIAGLLVEHILRRAAGRFGRPMPEVPAGIMRAFEQYDWPGNVRELANVVERAVILSDGPALCLDEPLGINGPLGATHPPTAKAHPATMEEVGDAVFGATSGCRMRARLANASRMEGVSTLDAEKQQEGRPVTRLSELLKARIGRAAPGRPGVSLSRPGDEVAHWRQRTACMYP